jgi:nicotinamide riboside kinase
MAVKIAPSAPLRIVLTGVESTGKSVLAERVALTLGWPLVKEAARTDAVVIQGKTQASDLPRLLDAQMSAAENAWERAKRESLDGVVVDTAGLALEVWGEEVFGCCPAQAFAAQHWFDLHLLCAPDLPWQDDPLRTLPRLEDRLRLHERFAHLLEARRWKTCCIRGNAHEGRFREAMSAIRSLRA